MSKLGQSGIALVALAIVVLAVAGLLAVQSIVASNAAIADAQAGDKPNLWDAILGTSEDFGGETGVLQAVFGSGSGDSSGWGQAVLSFFAG